MRSKIKQSKAFSNKDHRKFLLNLLFDPSNHQIIRLTVSIVFLISIVFLLFSSKFLKKNLELRFLNHRQNLLGL